MITLYDQNRGVAVFSNNQSLPTMPRNWLAQIFDKYYQDIYSYILSILRDHDDTLDVLQDFFLIIARSPRQFMRSMNLKPYLLAAARNETLKFLNQKSRSNSLRIRLAREFEIITPDRQGLNILDSQVGPEGRDTSDGIDNHCSALNQATTHLTPEHYEIIILKFYQGLTHAEVSRVVGAPVETCRSRYKSALKKLKEIMKDDRTE
ncbi:RNA polymerase sigma factor [Planctomycetota bacterium]